MALKRYRLMPPKPVKRSRGGMSVFQATQVMPTPLRLRPVQPMCLRDGECPNFCPKPPKTSPGHHGLARQGCHLSLVGDAQSVTGLN